MDTPNGEQAGLRDGARPGERVGTASRVVASERARAAGRRRLADRAGRALKTWSWLNLRPASAAQDWLRRHFTPAGQGVLVATLAAGLVGIDTRLSAAHQVFAFGVALLGVARLGTLRPLPRLHARRQLPPRAAVDEPVRYRVRLTSTGEPAGTSAAELPGDASGRRAASRTGKRPLAALTGALTLHERLPDPRPDLATFLDARAPVEARLNHAERLLGYPRWEWLVQQARRAQPCPPAALTDIVVGSTGDDTLEAELTLTPTRRGWLTLDALVLARVDPLGLMRRETIAAGPERLLVLPRRWPVPTLRPPGRRRLQPGGVEQAVNVGDSREFLGLRDYLPGDSPRHIHWAAWARCGEPVVKEYRDEFFSRQALVLDTCPAPGADPARFETAVSVAASLLAPLGAHPNGPDGLLDLILQADGTRILTAGRGLMSTAAMLELLACIDPQPPGGFAHLADTITARAPRLSACLLVLPGWDADRRELVARLRRTGLRVTVLLVAGDQDAPAEAMEVHTVDPADPAPAMLRIG